MTSPPYWGLRDYGSADQIGLEPTPAEYVAHLVEVFRAVRRALRDDGTVWLNIGDSYASGEIGRHDKGEGRRPPDGTGGIPKETGIPRQQQRLSAGLKPGDLVGIPWLVAFALQQDGWYLRSDVVWAKRNCMPESVAGWSWQPCRVKVRSLRRGNNRGLGDDLSQVGEQSGGLASSPSTEWSPCPGCDKCSATGGLVLRRGAWRPTRAHEMVFLLAKSPRYFCDGEAVRERALQPEGAAQLTGQRKIREERMQRHGSGAGTTLGSNQGPSHRNLRDVWHLSSTPSKLRHFAMMPPALVEKCILASCPAQCCSVCGAPWVPVIERGQGEGKGREAVDLAARPPGTSGGFGGAFDSGRAGATAQTILGHRATCTCDAAPIPGTVLDPFLGAGTVAGVAEALGRQWTGCELSADYAALVPQRIAEVKAWFLRQAPRKQPPRRAEQLPLEARA